ncbi:MAG: LapA family protein [Acidobacteria bacterium]|nr:LapA family protein [Acidobacteriota bacterium]
MPETDPRALWRAQPNQEPIMDIQQFVSRRTREMQALTRSEILGGMAASAVLLGVAAWRFAPAFNRWTIAALALILVWMAVSLIVFRRRLWAASPPPDALAAACSDYYRAQLTERRDHLRNEWLWHGPLALALVMFCVVAPTAYAHPGAIALFAAIVALWAFYGIWRRRRQANQLQREIDELQNV